jgi:iron complex transport system ATP-binding protein
MRRGAGIEARSLGVRLGSRTILHEVTVSVAPGELTALIGPNGAGKSTLLRVIAGLVELSGGSIRLLGADVEAIRADAALRARLVAYLPQDRTVHWPLKVRHIVALGRLSHRRSGPEGDAADTSAIDEAMRRMSVADLAGRPIDRLSGGEKARVLIARALAQQAPVLLADEPAAGLDPGHQLELYAMLRDLAREGRTIIVAMHDLSAAVRFADRAILLDSGRLVAAGPPADVLSPANLATAYGITAHVANAGGVPFVVPLGPVPHCDPNARAGQPAGDESAG